MAAVLAIVQFALVPILLAVALAVRFAGTSKPLNVVDYARVSDPVALHRWAGNRLLLLPVVFLVGGYTSYRFPGLALNTHTRTPCVSCSPASQKPLARCWASCSA